MTDLEHLWIPISGFVCKSGLNTVADGAKREDESSG